MRMNYGYVAIDSCLKSLLQKTVSRQDKLLGQVVHHWDDVIAQLHISATPVSISQNRNKSAQLVVQCSSAQAMKLSYNQGVLLEKLGMYLGYQPFESIRIKQYDEMTLPLSHNQVKNKVNRQTPSNELIHVVEDDKLKHALLRLSQHI